MYKCRHCGHIFDDGEQKTRYEKHNDYYTEIINACPICNSSDYEETVYCCYCHSEKFRDELNSDGICRECIESFIADNANDEKVCFGVGTYDKIQTAINSFIFDYFGSIDNIERHLLEYISGVQEIYKQDFTNYLKETSEDIISYILLNEGK